MENTAEIQHTIREVRRPLRRETAAWQVAAVGLFTLSIATNLALNGLYQMERSQWEADTAQLRAELQTAAETRTQAVRDLGALANAAARDELARQEQAEAYEAIGAYRYIGQCVVTAYCPCAECCGRWADGVTATGLPAGPGIVAVDPDVIPLGSTVVIDGLKYLAADTGVTGYHIDVCLTSHQETVEHGVQTSDVWLVAQ